MKKTQRKSRIICVLYVVAIVIISVEGQSKRYTKIQDRSYTGRSTFTICHTDLESKRTMSQIALDRYDDHLNVNISYPPLFVSKTFSRLDVLPTGRPLRVGDILKVRIRIFSQDGNPARTGGEYLRVWLKEPHLQANINGYIIDHGNGTYTGVIKLPWEGNPELIVSIANTREHISLIMNSIEVYGELYFLYSEFSDVNRNHTEETFCSPLQKAAFKQCQTSKVCNLTVHNYGLPWFCCEPQSTYLTCDDMKNVKSNLSMRISDETQKIAESHKHLRLPSVKLHVKSDVNGVQKLSSPSSPCYLTPSADTWNTYTPTGYFYLNKWINFLCNSDIDIIQKTNCFRNKRFVILGDSNSRSIYNHLCTMSNATSLTTPYRVGEPWHKLLKSKQKTLNTDLMWAPHNPPFYVGPYQPIGTMRSVGNWLDRTPHDKPLVVIIHLYYHLTRIAMSVFRAFVRDARLGIDRLLARAPDTSIVIQGPHALTYKGTREPVDYLRMCYEQIWYEEFKDIQDKVWYVDTWDMTVGMETVDTHPSSTVMSSVTQVILSHICPSPSNM